MTSTAFHWQHDCHLDEKEYLEDFSKFFDNLKQTFRKIEFGQTFAEPGNPSWEAFDRGDWDQALALMGQRSDEGKQYFEGLAKKEKQALRVRIVEEPFSDYLIWELNVLRYNEQLGEVVRVVSMNDARRLVAPDFLADFVTLDDAVAYRVLYGANGRNVGAERSTNRSSILSVCNAFDCLFDKGEPLGEFFAREIATLKPKFAAAR